MNSRERLLAVGLGVVLGGWLLWSLVQSRIVEPLRQRDAQIAALEVQRLDKQRQLQKAKEAAIEIQQWRATALPGDVSRAQTLYLDQLRRTLEKSGIERPTIRTSRPVKRGDHYSRIPVGVDARCRLHDLTAFLRQFADAPILQQIRRLRIQPVLKDGRIDAYDCSMSIEALSMPDALAKERLPSREDARTAIAVRPNRLEDEFLVFVSKNPFQPTEILDRGQRPEGPGATAAVRDERDEYYLMGTVTVDGASEVWLRHKTNSSRKVVAEGGNIEIGGFKGTVLKVLPDSILIQVDDKIGPVRIGQNLAAWKPAEDAKPLETPESSTKGG